MKVIITVSQFTVLGIMYIMRFVAIVATGIVATTAMPVEGPRPPRRDVFVPPLLHIKDSNVTAPIYDLNGPDVIFQNGLYVKPLAPGGSFHHSKTGLDSRDGYCSTYSYCNNAYVYIPSGYIVQSDLTIPYGSGDSLDGNNWGINQDFSGTTFDNVGDLGSWNTLNTGCLLYTEYIDCYFQGTGSSAWIASHNCLGYSSC
jgi:hypothetical protein